MANLAAFAPLFPAAGKFNYVTSVEHFLAQVFDNQKLQELLQDIKSRNIFGPCKAGANILFPILYIYILHFNY